MLQYNKCVVCDEEKSVGIWLQARFICLECEREIVHTETKDENYPFYLEKLRYINNSNTLRQ